MGWPSHGLAMNSSRCRGEYRGPGQAGGATHTERHPSHAGRQFAVRFLLAHPASERAPARVVPGQPGGSYLNRHHAEGASVGVPGVSGGRGRQSQHRSRPYPSPGRCPLAAPGAPACACLPVAACATSVHPCDAATRALWPQSRTDERDGPRRRLVPPAAGPQPRGETGHARRPAPQGWRRSQHDRLAPGR